MILKRLLCLFGKHAWRTKYHMGYDKQERKFTVLALKTNCCRCGKKRSYV